MEKMTIKAAMNEIKRLKEKVTDLTVKIRTHAANMDFEDPKYPDQSAQVKEWLQSARDSVRRIGMLRQDLAFTNATVKATVELGGKHVEHTLQYWISRRRELAALEASVVMALSDGQLKDGHIASVSPGGEAKVVKVRRYYDPIQRDKDLTMLREEPSRIDEVLELACATTELLSLDDAA